MLNLEGRIFRTIDHHVRNRKFDNYDPEIQIFYLILKNNLRINSITYTVRREFNENVGVLMFRSEQY